MWLHLEDSLPLINHLKVLYLIPVWLARLYWNILALCFSGDCLFPCHLLKLSRAAREYMICSTFVCQGDFGLQFTLEINSWFSLVWTHSGVMIKSSLSIITNLPNLILELLACKKFDFMPLLSVQLLEEVLLGQWNVEQLERGGVFHLYTHHNQAGDDSDFFKTQEVSSWIYFPS